MFNHLIYLNIAREISKLSKCVSIQVGCILVKEGRILSIGYNGTPPNYINCDEMFPEYDQQRDRELHHQWSLIHELHAEMNAILWAAKNGISIEGATLYCTHQPCDQCTKNILALGITNIYYKDEYDKVQNNIEIQKFIKDMNVNITQVKE